MRTFCLQVLALTLFANLAVAGESLGDARKRADELYGKSLWKEAFDAYAAILERPDGGGETGAQVLANATQCLNRLNRVNEQDALWEKTAAAFPQDWRVLWQVARSYAHANHYGFMVAGAFQRGHHRGGGQWVQVMERDRVRSLQLMVQAFGCLQEVKPADRGQFLSEFASFVLYHNDFGRAWRLQALTDLAELPDPEQGHYGHSRRGCPVDAEGKVVFHALPASWEAAKSDGERWRFLLEETAKMGGHWVQNAESQLADFAHQQFGVQTMANYGYRVDLAPEAGKEGPWSVTTLADDETLAKTAGGVQRFKLPRPYDYIATYKEHGTWHQLGQIYQNRGQYPKAADAWLKAKRPDMHQQVVGNWGRLEPVLTQPAGDQGATIGFMFRNAKRVTFTAHRLKVEQLLADVKNRIRAKPNTLDWNDRQVENLGYLVVHENRRAYLGDEVARWGLDLEPPADHFTRTLTVQTPLKEAGAYLLEAEVEGGNTTRVVVWLADTVLVHKQLDDANWYWVADAVTGKPVAGAELSFFGYDQEHVRGKRYTFKVKEFTDESDAAGQVLTDGTRQPRDYSWLVKATTPGGRLAWLGWQGVWYRHLSPSHFEQVKGFYMTDRPVYRPEQAVQFRAWLRRAKYDHRDVSEFADRAYTVVIYNPKNEKVYEKTLTTDAWGGLGGELGLPKDAVLGHYRIAIERGAFGVGSFRVEEYKKPEFEVQVEAPTKPVALGETFAATIKATYYHGAPVTEAKVKYTVERSTREATWYPPGPWDWLYGPGYWWFSEDWDWYPGWHRWGWCRPSPWWWWRQPTPPELVMENEVDVGADGTVKVEIDTAIAQALFGDDDHEYRITAEVVDASRRTIVGSGSVLVSQDAFRVTTWVDRGHYRHGDAVRASFAARTVDGKPVAGKAETVLYRITYDAKRTPAEQEVERWQPVVDADGRGRLQLTAGAPGQYRLSVTVTDDAGRAKEGAYVFNVAGEAGDGSFRFNDLELLVDQAEYAPGDTAKLMVNAEAAGSTVMLFLRPEGGVYPPPKVVNLEGRSATVELPITLSDMPNCFVEAVAVGRGKVHAVTREIIVPPASRILTVTVEPDRQRYRPDDQAQVVLTLTDESGEPYVGTAVATIYDKSVEYVSGGTNVPEIKAHFWQWRRRHEEATLHSLLRWGHQLLKQRERGMDDLGIFGRLLADTGATAGPGGGGGRGAVGQFGDRRKSGAALREEVACDAVGGAVPAAPAAMAKASAPAAPDGANGGAIVAAVIQPTVRSNFADTALWRGDLVTDEQGKAILDLEMPENLTTWKIRVWALGQGTRVGQGEAEVITSKDVIVRLQAPRFFVEKDEVVLSAVVHNYLDVEKEVTVQVGIDGHLQHLGQAAEGADQRRAHERKVTIPAKGETRVDWRVKAVKEGTTSVTMYALTDTESDAMKLDFPVKVHGAPRTESWSLALRPETGEGVVGFTVPEERREAETELVARYSPTLAGAMVDALPYLVSYPYGCTEQTLNRFLPTVLVQKILVETGVDLAAVRDKQVNLNAQEIGDPKERAAQWQRKHGPGWQLNPVFDADLVDDMVRTGVDRLVSQQVGDGGWGWFSGHGERSWPHTTAVVVHGLQVARANDVAIPAGVIEQGVAWLQRYQEEQVELIRKGRLPEKERPKRWKEHADNLDALVCMVLADADVKNDAMVGYLFEDRGHLAVYGLCTYGLALQRFGVEDKRDQVIRTIEQFLQQDDENQTAWLNLGNGGYWWYWYGSEFEAHAFYLKLLAATDPQGEKAPRLVKYLLNNRKHASYWNSTRDTAYCIEALAYYLRASGEAAPDMTVEVVLDGEVAKTVKITKDNLFSFDGTCTLGPEKLPAGEHTLTFRKRGTGPLYANAYLSYFSLEDHITAAGLEVKVQRNYFKLVRDDAKIIQEGGRGQVVDGKKIRYRREPIANLGEVASGDLVEIELVIDSKNDYEYLCIEDPKAAGMEPVDLQSGYVRDELGAYREFRDDRVTFCVQRLARGRHSLSYRVRAEIPGKFSALPTRIYGMYAPELRGNAEELKVIIRDRE